MRQGFTRVRDDIQQTKAAVEYVDLENKVQSDMIARAFQTTRQRMDRSEHALVLTKAVDELKARFPDAVSNDILQTALQVAPLLVLQSNTKANDFQSLFKQPVVLSAVLIGGLALFSELSNQGREPQEVIVTPAAVTLRQTQTLSLSASALDRNRKTVDDIKFQWESSDPTIARVDTNSGVVTAVAEGSATIKAIEQETNRKVSGIALAIVNGTGT